MIQMTNNILNFTIIIKYFIINSNIRISFINYKTYSITCPIIVCRLINSNTNIITTRIILTISIKNYIRLKMIYTCIYIMCISIICNN